MKDWRKTILRELEERKLTQTGFCKRMKFVKSHFNDVLKGRKPMTLRLAVSLEFMCIGTAEFWMTLQMKEDIKKEKERLGF